MAIYGYARASTFEQDVTLQQETLRRAGCEIVRSEKSSGASRAGRSELAMLLQFLRRGDTLMVTRVDRLARSIKDLQDIVHELRAAGVSLKATEQPIDTSTAAGKCLPRHAGRLRRVRDQPAPRAAAGRDRPGQGQRASTGAASRRSIRSRCGGCGSRRSWGPRRSPSVSGSAAPRSIGC